MTQDQCDTCAKPTEHCQDEEFRKLLRSSCLNYTPVKDGEIPFLKAKTEHAPFEKIKIEGHDNDHIESLLHMDGCECPQCIRMTQRGYQKIKYEWIVK